MKNSGDGRVQTDAADPASSNGRDIELTCPLPHSTRTTVTLAHGGGGRLSHELVEELFLPAFNNPELDTRHDASIVRVHGQRLAFTTDSFVVKPIFFPGGNIGSLAIHGTVNDILMAGAKPLAISAGLIIEEGFPMESLRTIVESMQAAAATCEVSIVTGDTKVVDKGKGDGIYINTSGIGVVETDHVIAPQRIDPGDSILVSGDLGRHGMAIMAVREGLEFESEIESDSAPLCGPVQQMLAEGIEVHCMRDLTRGGLASALNELAEARGLQFQIEESHVPVRDDVRGACEILGFDPLYVANEGRFVVFVSPAHTERALSIMRSHLVSAEACKIGSVDNERCAQVLMRSRIGVPRILDMLSGEQLPRIC